MFENDCLNNNYTDWQKYVTSICDKIVAQYGNVDYYYDKEKAIAIKTYNNYCCRMEELKKINKTLIVRDDLLNAINTKDCTYFIIEHFKTIQTKYNN